MKLLLGWSLKLGLVALICLAVTGKLQVTLPETVLGFQVPEEARQWVERNNKIGELGNKAQAGLKGVADAIR